MAKANACTCPMCNGKGMIDKATVESLKKAENEVDRLKAENEKLKAEKRELEDRIAGAIT
jgi:cell division protein FtsB